MKSYSILYFIVVFLIFKNVHSLDVHQEFNSVRNHYFESLRPKRDPTIFKECSQITEPYGKLIQNYTHELQSNCKFILRAPENHVVHFIKVSYNLINKKDDSNSGPGSNIHLYDFIPGSNDLTKIHSFDVVQNQRMTPFVTSTSNSNNVIVEIDYHENKNFESQNFEIIYEFLDKQKMYEALSVA